jgi:hypothetical protein
MMQQQDINITPEQAAQILNQLINTDPLVAEKVKVIILTAQVQVLQQQLAPVDEVAEKREEGEEDAT